MRIGRRLQQVVIAVKSERLIAQILRLESREHKERFSLNIGGGPSVWCSMHLSSHMVRLLNASRVLADSCQY